MKTITIRFFPADIPDFVQQDLEGLDIPLPEPEERQTLKATCLRRNFEFNYVLDMKKVIEALKNHSKEASAKYLEANWRSTTLHIPQDSCELHFYQPNT